MKTENNESEVVHSVHSSLERLHRFSTKIKPKFEADLGLSEEIVKQISNIKNEPSWMLQIRLEAYRSFISRPLPHWSLVDLTQLEFENIRYYIRPEDKKATSWDEVPPEIKETFEKIGVPEAERKYLAGSVAQFESEGIYSHLRKELEEKGVIFCDMDTAVQKYPNLLQKYFGKCVPLNDNKFSSLHYAVWSGGSFAYIPSGVKIDMPLQTYFRMNEIREGQFEHTLIIAEKDTNVHYVEGCTAPIYDKDSLHSAVVEIFVGENSNVRYTTVQNWSKNVYNLNTKRAIVQKNGRITWVGGSMGSKATMLYPCSVLVGDNSRAEHLNIALAGEGTIKEGGAKVIHIGKNTSSKIDAKSISLNGGHSIYRGLVKIGKNAHNSRVDVKCDAIILDDISKSSTYPTIKDETQGAKIVHEATAGRLDEIRLFYLQSRGISKERAREMLVMGFVEPVLKELPLEYAVELNRLISLEMKSSIG
ncbi:MAG: Fe-S cluster assembly protein SufB [Candidatus Anstonellales archaeon]